MKPLLLIIALTFPFQLPQQDRIKEFRNSKRFSVKYDKFKDRTQVEVGPFVVGGTTKYVWSGSQLYMTARFLFPGQTLKESPKQFSLWFQASGKGWTFLKDRDLYALIDGERFDLGEGLYDGDVGRYGGVREAIGFLVPSEVFTKLGNARSAELRIGRSELTLKDEHKEAFRDLLSLSR